MTARRYWQLAISASNSTGDCKIGTIELRLVRDGSGVNIALAGNGTASANVSGGGAASNAFDNNLTTAWGAGGVAGPWWITWDFGAGNAQDINYLTLGNPNNGDSLAVLKTADLRGSDDNATWDPTRIYVASHPATAGALIGYAPPVSTVANMSAPMGTLAARTGSLAVLAAVMGTLVATTGILATLRSPMGVMSSVSHDATGENAFAGLAPIGTLVARTGATVRLSAPMGTLASSATVPGSVLAGLTSPIGALLSQSSVGALMRAGLSVGGYGLVSYTGATAALDAPMGKLSGVSRVGVLVRVTARPPMGALNASATAGAWMRANLTAPMITVTPTMRTSLTAPTGRMTATARAVVVVTYEAYAINLNPGGQEPIYEVTHYTGWAFNQILSYQGNHYGIADSGIHLIGGDTDSGIPVAWDWNTHLTDFGTSQNKAVREVVFGGRISPSAVGKVSVHEEADLAYSYSTLRDGTAQNSRFKPGRGLKARYWSFGLSGTGAGDIDDMAPDAAELGRKM